MIWPPHYCSGTQISKALFHSCSSKILRHLIVYFFYFSPRQLRPVLVMHKEHMHLNLTRFHQKILNQFRLDLLAVLIFLILSSFLDIPWVMAPRLLVFRSADMLAFFNILLIVSLLTSTSHSWRDFFFHQFDFLRKFFSPDHDLLFLFWIKFRFPSTSFSGASHFCILAYC